MYKCDFFSCTFICSCHKELQMHLRFCVLKHYTCKRLKSNDERCGELVNPLLLSDHSEICETHTCDECVDNQDQDNREWLCIDKNKMQYLKHRHSLCVVVDEIKSLFGLFKESQTLEAHK